MVTLTNVPTKVKFLLTQKFLNAMIILWSWILFWFASNWAMWSSYEDCMAQFEANQKNIHIITKLFLSNSRVEVEFKTKKGNSFVTNSKVCRQYSSHICDFGVLPPSLISIKWFFAVGQVGLWTLAILLCFPSRRGRK